MNKFWENTKIGSIGTIVSGGTPSTKITDNWNGDIPWITPSELTALKEKYINGNTERKITEKGLKSSSAVMVPAGSLILSTRATIGDCGINIVPISTNQGFKNIIPNEKIIVDFLYYFIKSNKKELLRLSCGSTFLELSRNDLAKIQIPLLPLSEQKQIVSIIEKWDKYIELLDKKIEIKKNTKKYLQQVLLTGKVRLKGYDGEWEEVILGDICKVLKGRGLSKEKLVEDGKQECILYGELYTKYQEIIDTVVSRTDSTEGVKSKFGDILIPASTTTNALDVATASCLKKSDVLLGGDINIFRPKESVYGEYLAYLLSHSEKINMAKLAQGITIVHLYGKDVKELKISLPPLPEQKAISSILTKSDKEIKTLEKQKQLIEQQRKYLINNLVTGKIRIPKY